MLVVLIVGVANLHSPPLTAAIQEEMNDDSHSVVESADEWASPYFDASSAGSRGRKRAFGRQRVGAPDSCICGICFSFAMHTITVLVLWQQVAL